MATTSPRHCGTPDALGAKLAACLRRNPDQPVLLLGRGLSAGAAFREAALDLMEELGGGGTEPVALTFLSNAEPSLNPFSGLDAGPDDSFPGELAECLVKLLGSGRVSHQDRWPRHAVLLSPAAAEVLAQKGTTPDNALHRLTRAGGRVLVADTLFLTDRGRPLFGRPDLEPHEERYPAAWGELSERLDDWLRHPPASDIAGLRAFCAGDKPATLHVTHSWGGGVAQWLHSFIEADDHGVNFQLRSEGPESGRGSGQRLSLYLGNRTETPVAGWWMHPPIGSTTVESAAYRKILERIVTRYGIGRVMISSLVGHSLDALATGLPTVQVLHDFYPRWPLLGVHPGPYLGDGGPADLARALQEHRLLPDLSGHDAAGWERLGRRWRETVEAQDTHLIAPGHSVAQLLRQLDPAWANAEIGIIPHGLPRLPGTQTVRPKTREDGRLRLVVPGRMQEGKGKELLLEALPELTRYAQVCLLGAGKEGEDFFGIEGIDVIVEYRHEDLRRLLAGIGPDLAALLSVVPETFSYTLSEMQQLGVPTVATRVGSFEERIADGETGWLIAPRAEALVERVRHLAAHREEIARVREQLPQIESPGIREMVARYDRLCPPRPARPSVHGGLGPGESQAAALAEQKLELRGKVRQLEQEVRALRTEVDERTDWAEREIQERRRSIGELQSQLRERFHELRETRNALERQQAEHQRTVHDLEGMLRRLDEEHQWVLASRTWRFTKPFRVTGRVLANLQQARAWNPARWPALTSRASRTIRTRGWRGALLRIQSAHNRPAIPPAVDTASLACVGDPEAPQRLPWPDEPLISIVVPVHNQWTYTAACLRSLAETPCRIPFEVIVVDDQSSDETKERLAGIEGLVTVRNERNLGFVGSCNAGIEKARGDFTVLLNNDTQVLPGWLEALHATFAQFPDTGLAGARLLYPDGSLQEAGGIVFQDGSGWNYGKGDVAERPEYQYVREADYCSGACVMVDTRVLRELGGLDDHYAPAYYEDTDLAFRLREKGLKVRYQPFAAVVHHEGVTSGTDTASGTKRYQEINREKFARRWADELSSYPAPITDPDDRAEIRRARDHGLKGRVLVIDAYTPEPDQDSGSLRLRYLMDCMRDLGWGVTFLPDNRAHAGSYTTAMQQAGVEVLYSPWVDSLQRFFSERGAEFDFVMISRHYVASGYLSLLRRFCPRARFIFDTVDLHYLREERLANLENSLPLRRAAAQTRRSELGVITEADATLVVSPVEKSVLEEAAAGARVHVISNVHEVVGSQRPWEERKDIFFVGGYQHPPNIDAALWFCHSIWPLIREQLPDVVFHLIGSKAPEQVRALHGGGVHFHGYVPDLEPWLDGCRIAVAPLRYGAGIKGKVNLSMSRGQPVVATPAAVEGMFARAGSDVLVAETAEDFAGEVVRLYRDEALWNRVSTAGLENVRQYFSVETARLGLQELFRSLAADA